MKITKFLIRKFKIILNFLAISMNNTGDMLKYQGRANIGEIVDIISILRYYFFDSFVRIFYLLGRIRYENLYFFLFGGKINKKSISEFAYEAHYKKLFRKRIRKNLCFNTLSCKLNFLRNKAKVSLQRSKVFAVLHIIVLGLFTLGLFFTYKDENYKNYYLKLYNELFSKGFWKSSIFKCFLFKGENYVEDLMQYEGNSIVSFSRLIFEKIIRLYNTFCATISINNNKKTKKFLRNIKFKIK